MCEEKRLPVIEGSAESLFIDSYTGWDGGSLDWLYFYNVALHPAIMTDCQDKGCQPTDSFDLEINLEKMEAAVYLVGNGDSECTPIVSYKLKIAIQEKL